MILGGIDGLDRTLGSAIKVTRGVEHKHGILLQVVFSGSAIPCHQEYDKPNSRGHRYLSLRIAGTQAYSATLHIYISVSNTQIDICRSDPGMYSYASHPQNAGARWTRMMEGFSAVIESILITGIDTIVAWRVFMMQVVGEKGDKVCTI